MTSFKVIVFMFHVSCSSFIISSFGLITYKGFDQGKPPFTKKSTRFPFFACVIVDLGALELEDPLKNTLQSWRNFFGVASLFTKLISSLKVHLHP
jgi:hypothetical protein